MTRYPFIFGAQYYRAPTPERECWHADLSRMRDLGFNAVKFWVQWRWSHRAWDRFCFDDVDALMDLAHSNGLAVTLNTIFDVSPVWLFERYPDAKQVNVSGQTLEPYVVSHRQIGGHPGPCYNHPGALEARRRFMAELVDHFKGRPALSMWDVWNEPEQSFGARQPDWRTLVCYCPHCRAGFERWLEGKYGQIERLNQVWGRCYEAFAQIELPRTGGGIADFVDWREFHLDTMTAEATWRLDMTRERDPDHLCYLHVVPNVMSPFNAVTCVDDFALAEKCDVFAATMNGGPVFPSQVISAARGKVCYNVESHVNYGSLGMHQRMLGLDELLADFLPQIGMGVKGFLFWQYRPEVLGVESPAWGLVRPDGADRPITRAVASFWQALSPCAESLMKARPAPAEIGIWKSRKNEVFHFAVDGSLQALQADVEGYIHLLHRHNYPFRIISGSMLAAGQMEDIRVLVMPSCYYVTQEEADTLDRWVRGGGVLLCEAHLAGYSASTGRHSRTTPGCGLAESWGLQETDTTSSFNLRLDNSQQFDASVPEDVRKALSDFGVSGGRLFPISLDDGAFVWGARRYAALQGDGLVQVGSFDGVETCIASVDVGDGMVMYCGTNPGEGAAQGEDGLLSLIAQCARRGGVRPTLDARAQTPGSVQFQVLQEEGAPRFVVVVNSSDQEQQVELDASGRWEGLFTGASWDLSEGGVSVPAGFIDLLVVQ